MAFAFGRALGPAVTRNRLRRRLRHALAQRPLPAGLYLFGARPAAAQQSFSELMCDLDRMLAKLPRAGSSQVTGAAMPVMHTNTVTAPDTETVTVTDGLSARPVGG